MEEKSKAKTHLSLIRAGHQVGLILYFFHIVRKARPEGRIRRDSSFLRFQSEVCVQHQRKGIQPPSIRIRITSKTAKKNTYDLSLISSPIPASKTFGGRGATFGFGQAGHSIAQEPGFALATPSGLRPTPARFRILRCRQRRHSLMNSS